LLVLYIQVSNGAEVILISKSFISRYLTDCVKEKLKKQVMVSKCWSTIVVYYYVNTCTAR